MSTHAQVAKSVREHKEQYPERYCRMCLYRVLDRNGNLNPNCQPGACPRHPRAVQVNP